MQQEKVQEIKAILSGQDPRLILIIGPCSADNEFAVLEYLLRNPGRVLSRDKIENHVWN